MRLKIDVSYSQGLYVRQEGGGGGGGGGGGVFKQAATTCRTNALDQGCSWLRKGSTNHCVCASNRWTVVKELLSVKLKAKKRNHRK
jgi:hypothetical protein